MPVTSGPRLYDVLESWCVRTVSELKERDPQVFVRDVMQPNISHGERIARRVQRNTTLQVIAPAVFNAKKQHFKDPEYMSLWLQLIEGRANEMYMADGWEYSTGCAQEFVKGMHMQFFSRKSPQTAVRRSFAEDGKNISMHKQRYIENCKRSLPITVFTQAGNTLQLDKGFSILGRAIEDLHERGFDHAPLDASLEKLYEIGQYFVVHSNRGCAPYTYDWKAMAKMHDGFKSLSEKF
jgi:hypothetical protein